MIHQHGFAISGTYMLPTAALLTDSFRVYVPDLPGFGRSPKPEVALSIEELGTALNHFMAALGIEQAMLVGNSLGCAITAQLIDEAPEKVSKAILVSLAGGAHNRPLGKGLVQMARDGLAEPPSLLPVAVPDYLRFGMVRAMRLFIAMTHFPAYERIVSMQVPAMVVIGSEDPVRPSWQVISRALSDVPEQVTIVLFQGARARYQLHPSARAVPRDPPVRRGQRGADGHRKPRRCSGPAAPAAAVTSGRQRAADYPQRVIRA